MLQRLSASLIPPAASARDLVRVPGLLSLSRLALAALFPLTLGHAGWALAVLGAAGVTDVLDGWYARRFHQESSLGAALDAFTDKVFVMSVVLTLLLSGTLSLLETVLLGTRDMGELALLLYLRVTGRTVVGRSANVGGKVATAMQYAALVAVLLRNDARYVIVAAAAFAGVLATISYWRRDTRARAVT